MWKIASVLALLICVLTVGQARESKVPDCTAAIPTPGQFEDPNYFYLCNELGSSIIVACDKDRHKGFLDNKDFLGCVPWEKWECLKSHTHSDCSDPANAGKKIMFTDPNQYLECPSAPGTSPAGPTKCDKTEGFDPTATPPGCVDWKQWKVCD